MAETSSGSVVIIFVLILLAVLHSTSGNEIPHKRDNTETPMTRPPLLTSSAGEDSLGIEEVINSKRHLEVEKHNAIPFINKTDFSESKIPPETIGEVTRISYENNKNDNLSKPREYPNPNPNLNLNLTPVLQNMSSSDNSSLYSVSNPFGFDGRPLLTNRTQKHGYKTHNNLNNGNQPLARAGAYPNLSPSLNAIKSNNYSLNQLQSFNGGWNARLQNEESTSGSGDEKESRDLGDFRWYREIVRQILERALAGMENDLSGKAARCKTNNQLCLWEVANNDDDLAKQESMHDQTPQTKSNPTTYRHDKYTRLKKALGIPKRVSRRSSDKTRRNTSPISTTTRKTGENRMTPRRPSFRSPARNSGTSRLNNNNDNNNNNGNSASQGGNGASTPTNTYPSGPRANTAVDQSVFSQFASETMSFERQSASEITRLDNLLRQLALAAQTDFSTVSANVNAVQQQLLQTQQQLVQAWKLLNDTHSKDNENTLAELHDVKTDVYRLHALLTGATPMGQPTAQGRVAEVREETRAGVDCASLAKYGVNSSGVYDLQPDPSNNQTRMTAYCDMDTNGGGWTVFQRRKDGSDDFFRGWNSYKHGFGSYHHDHWLGLENIHLLTQYGDNVMRIELMDWDNETRWAEFSYTRILGESDGYRILVGGYRGNAGDPFHSLSYDMRMQSMRFSTFDSDNDMDNGGNCALTFTSGWWFNKCFQINLNGVWYGNSRYAGPSMNGIVWDLWPEHFNGYSLKQTEMKLRPANFLTTK